MGDWKKYYESRGFSVGSSEDYDRMIDLLDERRPRSRPQKNPPLDPPEAISAEERELFVAELVAGVVNGGWDVSIETDHRTPGSSSSPIAIFDGSTDESWPDVSLRVNYNYVSISALIDAMRSSGVPLICEEGDWLAWDIHEKCVKSAPDRIEWLWQRDAISHRRPVPGEPSGFGALARVKARAQDPQVLRMKTLILGAMSCSDHGKKPLVLHESRLNDAVARRAVEFEGYRQIRGAAVDDYLLAYYDAAGEVVSVPLKQAMDTASELGVQVCTRTGNFDVGRHPEPFFTPCLSYAKLLVGAFEIATRNNPNEFKWFAARQQGTVFQSAFEQIEPPLGPSDHSPFTEKGQDKRTYSLCLARDAAGVANELVEWATPQGKLYITVSGHPLDAEYVTTPELYRHAVVRLIEQGYSFDYTDYCRGVKVKKAVPL